MKLPAILIAWCLLACGSPDFTTAYVDIDYTRAVLSLRIAGPEEPPCPEIEETATFRIGETLGSAYSWGGEARDPDVRYGYCEEVEVEFYDLVLDGQPLSITVDSERHPMRLEARVPDRFEIWSDDDLHAAIVSGLPFDVAWTPEDAERPTLTLYIDSDAQDLVPELIDSSPGAATYRFVGAPSAAEYTIAASSRFEREATVCDGLVECHFVSSLYIDLGPRAGVAPRAR